MNLKQEYDKVDRAKFDLMEDGYAFDFSVIDQRGQLHHCGIGDAGQMSLMCLISLCDLFHNGGTGTVEDFADSVRDTMVRFYKEQYPGYIRQSEEVPS